MMRDIRFAALAGLALLAGCATPPPPGPPPYVGSFGNFHPPKEFAHFIACPQSYCLEPNEFTPLLNVPADKMRFIVKQALDAQPRMELLSSTNEGLRLVYRQRPFLWGIPNIATVEIVDADEGVSGIVIYSQADGKAPDWHANRDQVDDLLEAINDAVAKSGALAKGGTAPK